jgi:chloride channel 2
MAIRVPIFKDIGTNYQAKLQMLSAAIGAGTVVTFGAPIGAVLFAMELTSTYFMVGTLLRCFLCSVAAIIVYHMMHSLPPIRTPKHTDFEDIGLNHEIIFFIILGVLSAKVAVLFNHILTKIIFLRVKLKNPFISNRWKWCSTVTLFISIIGFPITYMHISEKNICDMFFSNVRDLSDFPAPSKCLLISLYYLDGHKWAFPDVTFNLLVYCILKFFFIILSVSCPIPNGIFAPIYSLGGGFGRLYAHVIRLIGERFGL